MVKTKTTIQCLSLFLLVYYPLFAFAEMASIPLPEHPRPDFERSEWINLNGTWAFQFDKEDAGVQQKWFEASGDFRKTIVVPFPWGSKLSTVESEADIAWYARTINVPESWKGQRVFLVVGACDWKTTAWIDGNELGTYQGGYTPFEFELTSRVQYGKDQSLVLRVDDTDHPFKLFGKQGYGAAKGIWQTPYLEARGTAALAYVHFSPDIDKEKVGVKAELIDSAPSDLKLQIQFKGSQANLPVATQAIVKGKQGVEFDIPISKPHLWSLDDPFLYEVEASVQGDGLKEDRVNTYFGMRKIGIMKLPGTDFTYISLNNKPIYLQLTLDQAYHPDGFYTFPSDEFTRDEILRSKRIGLNGMRVHVKVPLTRKLYWADRLGMLIMSDVPNSWGEPDADMRNEMETALRAMIRRDYNHPSIFSWITFNETWGLKSGEKKDKYLPETQKWVASMYRLAKSLDPTRLVEDNSPCLYDHVETDMNSWHSYLPGYKWKEFLDVATQKTFPGSEWNFAKGYKQGDQPMFNSECGNVWGYEGSTGDVDWSWDYHLMMNEFRIHPKICGWLYTEHHDVINEWNGYYRFDRSEKFTGMDELVPGMSLNDLHDPYYVSVGNELCQELNPGEEIEVPVYASFLTDQAPSDLLQLKCEFFGWDTLGNQETYALFSVDMLFKPWLTQKVDTFRMTMPPKSSLAILRYSLQDAMGNVLHRNFTTFLVLDGASPRDERLQEGEKSLRVIRFAPDSFKDAKWSTKQWNVLDGKKANGAGSGYFEYRIPWPNDLNVEKVKDCNIRFEASAKQLFGKDRDNAGKQDGDYMLGKGTIDPSLNPNSYPMTDETRYPSRVRVRVNGTIVGTFDLPDDPADHRGILSWQSQPRDSKLREAGSYGYLISASIPKEVLTEAEQNKEIVVRLEVDDAYSHGLAIYGERFGRYPIDPSLIFNLQKSRDTF